MEQGPLQWKHGVLTTGPPGRPLSSFYSPLDDFKVTQWQPQATSVVLCGPWISIGRTDDEAEAPILWPPDAKS